VRADQRGADKRSSNGNLLVPENKLIAKVE
jgi:hypothetical protein